MSGPVSFDIVVLGGGTAGCVLAARLSEDNDRTVCLVEAGPDYGAYDEGRWPADLLDARQLAFSHSWETDREDRSQLRARVIGGCSAHNACVVLEGSPADYDEWGPGWTYTELEPYLRRARGQMRVREIAEEELSPWHRAFAESGGADACRHPVNSVGTVRWNLAFSYLDPARGRPNLTIRADTLVDRIDPEHSRVVTDRGEIKARTIVFAASSYGTPGILLRSGLGADLPVGENLIDHVGVGFGYEPTARCRHEMARFETESPLFMAQVTVRLGGGDLFFFPAAEPGCEISAAVFVMKPFSRGRVSLGSRDPRAALVIDHGFLADERDAEALTAGVEELRRRVAIEPLSHYAARETRPGPHLPADEYVRRASRGFFHPVGTCAIGSVVDTKGRILGHENLYVADASIMSTIPRANTNLTVAAIAERIAEAVRRI
jgi:choline dehydrogenase-like flavoprotein